MTDRNRVMPEKVRLGQSFNGPMSSAMRFRDGREFLNPQGLRKVMGFILPPWQRGFVWTEEQSIRFVESAWLGMPLGTYTVNLSHGSGYDGWLIDGQQRMRAIELYLSDAFPACGYRWSEVTEVDRRDWEISTLFNYYETRSHDEAYLREYYTLMNFGGTPHTEADRPED